MFGIFTRKNKHAELVPEVAETQMPNLATMLIISMTAYIRQNEQTAGAMVPVINDVRAAYNRLLKLGMGQTQNAKALQVQVEANDQAINNQIKAQNLIHFIKDVHKHFGSRSILVSYTAFDDLCKRYGLEIGPLSSYCGVIPERNVQDIENFQSNFDSFRSKRQLNANDRINAYGNFIFVTGADIHSDDAKFADFIKENNNILQLHWDADMEKNRWSVKNVYGFYSRYKLTTVYGKPITRQTLFIACPKQYLNNPGITIQPKPVDPAVFQFTPYGVLVHTIWGEEAEDVAFKEFMDINLRIANS